MKSKNSEIQAPELAYRYALRLLTGRDYTVLKLRGKLVGREFSERDTEDTIIRLQSEGWLDDRRYAVQFAESVLSTGRFFGPRLRQEMRRRGFESVLVEEILGRLLSDFDETGEAMSIVARRYPDFRFSTATDRDKRRVIGFLQRRGFGISSIMRALRTEERSY